MESKLRVPSCLAIRVFTNLMCLLKRVYVYSVQILQTES